MNLTLYFLTLCLCASLLTVWGAIPYNPNIHRERPTVFSRLFLLTLALAAAIQAMHMYPFAGRVERLMIEGMLADLVVMLTALASLFALLWKSADGQRAQRAWAAKEKWAVALLVPTLLAGLAVFEFLIARVLNLHA